MPQVTFHTVLVCTILASSLLGISGCARIQMAVVGSLVDNVAMAASKGEDPALIEGAIPTFLLLLEGLLEGSPDNVFLRLAASEAYTSYAVLVELSDPERAGSLHWRAHTHSRVALNRNRKARALLDSPYEEFASITAALDEADLPAVFWTASSWGAWISTNTSSIAALAELPRVILLMEWVLERDEAYFNGNPHVFLGIYHAALPPTLGGKPNKALAHFKRAEELAGGRSLMVPVQMARFYARQVFDRDLYESLLRRVLEAPADIGPAELTLQNKIARSMARELLSKTDEFF